jgi:photosystem II stability/assembly factor-like uncharacterized protein
VSILKKNILLCLFTIFQAQALFAQSNWISSKSSGSSDLVAVYFTSSERGFVAGDKGYFAYTNDGGDSWTKQTIDTNDDINEIYFRNDDNGYVVAGKKMFLTSNGGRNWREILIFNPNDFKDGTPEILSVRFADKKRGFVIGSVINKNDEVIDSVVMRTDDGGETWSRIIVPSKRELYHLDFANGSRGWIVGDKGIILATFDGGVNWQVQKTGTDKALYNVDFRDSENGFAVGGKGTILRTENGGGIWEPVKTGFPNTFMRVNFADDRNAFIVGYGGAILRTSDKGKTWIKQDNDSKDNLYGLFITKKYGWAVGAKGLIMKYQR